MTRRSGSGRYTPPKRALILTGDVHEDDVPQEQERAARRRILATTGRCPCGAMLNVPDRLEPGTVTVVIVEHEPDCPACDEVAR